MSNSAATRVLAVMVVVFQMFVAHGAHAAPGAGPDTFMVASDSVSDFGIQGRYVCYADGEHNLTVYDLTDRKQIARPKLGNAHPVVDHDMVIWRVFDGNGLHVYSIKSKTTRLIPVPGIRVDDFRASGDWVAVGTHDAVDPNASPIKFNDFLYAFNLKTKEVVGPITKSRGPRGLDISGTTIAWLDNRPGAPGIYFFDLTTRRETFAAKAGMQTAVSTDGKKIVWGEKGDISAYDIVSAEVSTIASGDGTTHNSEPFVDGEWVAWQQSKGAIGQGPNSQIVARRLGGGDVKPISDATMPALCESVQISGHFVLWIEGAKGALVCGTLPDSGEAPKAPAIAKPTADDPR